MPASDLQLLFATALTARRAADPALFETYFFDAGVIYLYLGIPTSALDLLTNFVHEHGHSLLANSPLGFLHQSLFQIESFAADYLWTRHFGPVLRRHAASGGPYPSKRVQDVESPRGEGRCALLRRDARALLESARADLLPVLEDADASAVARSFQTIRKRREVVATASLTCQEAIATFWQLSPDTAVVARYLSAPQGMMRGLVTEVSSREVESLVRERREALTGRYRRGYDLAASVYERTGSEAAVVLAGHAAHHFAYEGCDLLDMQDSEFGRWAETTLLSADRRFEAVCRKPELLSASSIRTNGGSSLLRAVLEDHHVGPVTEEQRRFSLWHRDAIIGSKLMRPLAKLIVPSMQSELMANDTWCARLMPLPDPRLIPPLVFDDGRVLAPTTAIAQTVMADFVRAERVRAVGRFLDRLCT